MDGVDNPDVVQALVDALGSDLVQTASIDHRFSGDWSSVAHIEPKAVVLPRTTNDVSLALAICNDYRQPVVTQGGLTGLAGGATPRLGDVVINVERMSGVVEIDRDAATITVWAGTTLQAAQDAANAAGLELTLDLGARGSCHIGGNVATNAGGNRVIRYGMARDHVLGLEAVLADGTVVSSMNKMIKNNAGYDVKQYFIGSEGTLGIITRVVLRLRPAPRSRTTMLCACPDYESVIALLQLVQNRTSGLSAFEVMWPHFYRFVSSARGVVPPVAITTGMAVLVEVSGDDPDADERRIEHLLTAAIQAGHIVDAYLATSAKDVADMWTIREAEPIDRLPSVINFDVSIEIGQIGHFATECERRLLAQWPAADIFLFGHIGDSNLHLSMSVGPADEHLVHLVDEVVYNAVREWGGSVSAEHGIGVLKRDYLSYSRSAAELDVMLRIKRALDPHGIMNPDKVLASPARPAV